jgi:hypothetical protein
MRQLNKYVVIIGLVIMMVSCIIGGWTLRGKFIPEPVAPDTITVTKTVIETVKVEKVLPAEIIYIDNEEEQPETVAYTKTRLEKDGFGIDLDLWYYIKKQEFQAKIRGDIPIKTIYKTNTIEIPEKTPTWTYGIGAEWITTPYTDVYLGKFGVSWKRFLYVKTGLGIETRNIKPAISIEAGFEFKLE